MKRGFFVFVTVLAIAMSFAAFGGDSAAKKVLATVGEQKITQQDLDAFLQKVPAPFRNAFRKKALYGIIETKVFSAVAKKQGLDNAPDFLARLEKEKKRLLAAYYMEKELKPRVKISPSQAKSYYEKHKAEFRGNERVKVEEMRFSGRKKAEVAKAKLIKGEVLPNAMGRKGLWIEKGKIPKEIESAVFSLKPGQISDIVQFKTEYFIFRVIDRKGPGIRPFEEVKSSIIKRMEARKLVMLKQEQLRKAGVRILDKSFEQSSGSGNGAFPPAK